MQIHWKKIFTRGAFRGREMIPKSIVAMKLPQRLTRWRWLTEYGDLFILVLLFFVLLYTIMWATDNNIYQGADRLVAQSYSELKTFCQNELAPGDYSLERVKDGVLIHLPTQRWFEEGRAIIKPGMQPHLVHLARKVGALKLLSSSLKDNPKVLFNQPPVNEQVMHVQLRIGDMGMENTSRANVQLDRLFQDRAQNLVTMLNESLSMKDYLFEVGHRSGNVAQELFQTNDRMNHPSHTELTMFISASFATN